ncbi:MAG: efflux RND transporter periplasmic adaptor subunit [Proteobacteria bacterium]|nr:efflux RND transporter periplasmic adaptor subunit [Pseudomonadota bacterium]
MMKNKKIIIAVIVVALIVVVYGYMSKKKPPPPEQRGVPVLVGKAVQKTMPVIVESIGTVEAYNTVTIISRVMGQLLKIHFKEGQDVRKGESIFTIDPGTYKEKLKNAEAKLAQDLAQLQYNESEAKRYAFLLEKGAVSKSDFENKQTLAATYEAIVKADRADVENARLQLDYCYIRSPLDGRTGTYGVHEGAMVKDNDTKLAVVNQITPIYVKFSVPEKQLSEIRKYMAKGSLKVKVNLTGIKENVPEGILSFIDNTVDPATGMILLKATFPNKDKFLWPGQFVNVVLQLAQEPNAIVVPAPAVQISQGGSYVFVVKPDNKVEFRLVTAERTIGDETVLSKGVSPGETVVTDGHLKLKDGFPVEIRESLLSGNSKTQNPQDSKK